MTKEITRAFLALAIVLGLGAAASRPAEAGRGDGVVAGVAVGTLLGLGIAGAYAGPRQCGWAGRNCWRNPYGETVCQGGEWRCWRPTVCN
jgi:hypothetical protein